MNEETHTTVFPHFAYPVHYHWRSVPFVAKLYKRTPRRIRQLCERGFFAKKGIPVYQDKSNRWWVALTEKQVQSLM